MFRQFRQGRLERQHSTGRIARAIAFSSIAALAVGCGGDGGSSGPRTLTGVFVDSPVAGVGYQTATQSGVTNTAGEFTYLAGETVTFTLGTVELGSTDADAEVTVFDVAGVVSLPANLREFEREVFPPSGERGPFEKAINLSILLQTLDDDSNPDNGIVISSDVAALVTPELIDLSLPYYDFRAGGNERDGTGILKLLRDAAAQSLLTARPVRDAGSALNHAIVQAGASIPYEIATVITQDAGNDGSIDYRRDISYDSLGYYLGDRVDSDGDGVVDATTTYVRDSNGLTTRYEQDRDGDGVADRIDTRSYDEFGLLRVYQREVAGVVEFTEEWIRDEAGRAIEQRRTTLSGLSIYQWRVDAEGRRSTYEIDSDGDGNIDRRDLLSYGTQTRGDRWIGREIDLDMDGTIDSRQTREFDANGNLVLDERDDDLDGTLDYRYVAEHTGSRVTAIDVIRTSGSNYAQRWTLDAEGRTTQYSFDNGRDGSLDQVVSYAYNSAGNLVEQTVDNNGDGVADNRYTYVYDASGNQVESTSDNGADGVIDQRSLYTYDASGRRVSDTFDRGADGSIEFYNESSEWVDIGIGRYL